MSSERTYHANDRCFFDQYQSIVFDQVHRDWSPLLPNEPGMAMDGASAAGAMPMWSRWLTP